MAATAALHREVGPARTTIADIARRAGVQRLTVYNNFPDARDLLGACQRHFLTHHPPPDLSPTPNRAGTLARLEAVLRELYSWYRANESMQRHVHHDRHLIPELDELMRQNADPHFDAAAAAYAELIAASAAQTTAVRRLIRLALEFATWELLASRGATDADIARLFRRSVSAVAKGS